MWAISEDILSDELIDELLHRADYFWISSDDSEKHVFVDKDFFSNNGDEPRNLDILNNIHKAVWSKISESFLIMNPLLIMQFYFLKDQEVSKLSGIKIVLIGPRETRYFNIFRLDRSRRYYGGERSSQFSKKQ